MLSREASRAGAGRGRDHRRRPRRHRPRHRQSRPAASLDRLRPAGAARRRQRRGVRHRRRLPRLHLRAHRGRGAHRLGAERDRARGRRREALHHHRFPGPLDRHPVRRRRGRIGGAGARARPGRGILSTFIKSDGRLAPLLYRPGGGSADPISEKVVCERSHYMKMAGREVFKAAVLAMAEACDEALRRAGVTADQVDLLVPHQANLRIIEATAKHAGHADVQGDGQRRPLRQHLVRLDPAGARAGDRRGAGRSGLGAPAGGVRRRASPGAARSIRW